MSNTDVSPTSTKAERVIYKFVREGRKKREKAIADVGNGALLNKRLSKEKIERERQESMHLLHIVNRPARFPPGGLWPFEMRADMVAAALDFRSTKMLLQAVKSGEAPRPTGTRGEGRNAEVVWSSECIRLFVQQRHTGSQQS